MKDCQKLPFLSVSDKFIQNKSVDEMEICLLRSVGSFCQIRSVDDRYLTFYSEKVFYSPESFEKANVKYVYVESKSFLKPRLLEI